LDEAVGGVCPAYACASGLRKVCGLAFSILVVRETNTGASHSGGKKRACGQDDVRCVTRKLLDEIKCGESEVRRTIGRAFSPWFYAAI